MLRSSLDRRAARGPTILAGLIIATLSPPVAADDDRHDDPDAVYPYDGADYYYRLDHGFVFLGPRAPAPAPVELSLTASVHRAVDADAVSGAVAADAGRGLVRISAAAHRYRRDAPDVLAAARGTAPDLQPGAASDRLDLWRTTAGLRLLTAPRTALWLDAGAAGLHATDHHLGAVAGLALDHTLSPDLSAHATARTYLLEHRRRALEASAAVGVSILRLGYHVLDTPTHTLHGPQAALHLTY